MNLCTGSKHVYCGGTFRGGGRRDTDSDARLGELCSAKNKTEIRDADADVYVVFAVPVDGRADYGAQRPCDCGRNTASLPEKSHKKASPSQENMIQGSVFA